MRVAAIMPCRGRAQQTATNVRRLLATSGYTDWQLHLIGTEADMRVLAPLVDPTRVILDSVRTERLTYWQALRVVTYQVDSPLLANLANDLLPGQHWLARAVAAYRQTFGDGAGMVGFNDGHHEVGHSCHFLIHRDLLERYGGWPVWYDHTQGDTELCQRAIDDGVYVKAPWATLFHDHPYFGGTDDPVYAEGRARIDHDAVLYTQRRIAGWPPA